MDARPITLSVVSRNPRNGGFPRYLEDGNTLLGRIKEVHPSTPVARSEWSFKTLRPRVVRIQEIKQFRACSEGYDYTFCGNLLIISADYYSLNFGYIFFLKTVQEFVVTESKKIFL